MGGPGARRARRARDTGHLHDLDARGLARLRRRALAARHGVAGRHTRVRRAHHRGPLLLQGTPRRRLARRRSAHPLQGRPRTHRPPRRARGALRRPRAPPERRRRRSPSCSPTTRPNTRGWATPSGWIPRRAPSGCSAPCARPATRSTARPRSGDDLIHSLIAAGGHDLEFLTADQLGDAAGRLDAERYAEWFARLPEGLRSEVEEHWGPPPGELYVDGRDFVVAGLTFGNVFVGIQPPRGFGENPIAIYHDPDLPPTHHYLAAYWWMIEEFGADADSPPRQARHPGVAAGQISRSLALLRPRCRPARRAALLSLRRQRSRRGDAGQEEGARHRRGPPDPPDDPRRDLRRPGEAGATPGRVLPGGDARPLEAARDTGPYLGDPARRRAPPRPRRRGTARGVLGLPHPRRRIPLRDQRPPHPRRPPRPRRDPRGRAPAPPRRPILRLGAGEVPGLRRAVGDAFGLDERSMAENGGTRVEAPPALAERFPGTVATASDLLDRLEEAQQALLLALEARGWDAEAAGTVCEEVLGVADAGVVSSPALRRRRGRAAPDAYARGDGEPALRPRGRLRACRAFRLSRRAGW